jgi:hypothetical protein
MRRPQTMAALANASQNATTSRRRSVPQRSLPHWLPQAWCARPPSGDLAGHGSSGQHLPARLVVGTGVQVDHRPLRQGPTTAMASRVAASSPSSRWLVRAGTAASGMPSASTVTERLRPCLRRSIGLGLATWPPPGPWWCSRPPPSGPGAGRTGGSSAANSTARRSCSATPVVIHPSRRRRRVVAEQVLSAMRRAPQPNTSTWMSLSNTMRWGCVGGGRRGVGDLAGGSSAATWTQRGSGPTMAGQARGPPDDRRVGTRRSSRLVPALFGLTYWRRLLVNAPGSWGGHRPEGVHVPRRNGPGSSSPGPSVARSNDKSACRHSGVTSRER